MGLGHASSALRRVFEGALFGLALMPVCTVLCLFDGLVKAREFGIGVGALTVAHFAVAIFKRQVVRSLRELPWARGVSWSETEAGTYASQFAVGLAGTVLAASALCLPPNRTLLLGLIVVPLAAAATLVSTRRRGRTSGASYRRICQIAPIGRRRSFRATACEAALSNEVL